jgi:predicted glycosyl hydrolase (DUF1957 family)
MVLRRNDRNLRSAGAYTEHLVRDNVDFRITISLSPPLISMMQDELIMGKFKKHLKA